MRLMLSEDGVAASEAERITQETAALVQKAIQAARADALPVFEDAAGDVYSPVGQGSRA